MTANGQWITVAATHHDIPRIVRQLVEAGIDIYHVSTQRQSLEAYFLAVTQDNTSETEASHV